MPQVELKEGRNTWCKNWLYILQKYIMKLSVSNTHLVYSEVP